MKSTRLLATALATAIILFNGAATFAQSTTPLPGTVGLSRVGPVSTSHGYPLWYQDKSGLALDFCDNQSQAELDGGWCVLLPPDLSGPAPEVFPSNFVDEHFYWLANSGDRRIPVGTSGQTVVASLVLALEGAFASGPVVQGDQMVFARLRIKLLPLPYDGDYTVYTPFGIFPFTGQVAGDKIFFTQDIGLTPGNFNDALHGSIGPFLLPSDRPGGAELPPIPQLQPDTIDPYYTTALGVTAYPANGRKYIADPARLGPLTGSPFGTFTLADGSQIDANVFRIEGPNGFVYQSNDFSIGGRVYENAMPAKMNVNRANYWRSAAGGLGVHVWAQASPIQEPRIPGGLRPATVPVDLAYYHEACSGTINPVTGLAGPPYGLPANATLAHQMFSDGGATEAKYYGESVPAALPKELCVVANSVNAAGQTVSQFVPVQVTDHIAVTQATYDASQRIMTITAVSSDAGSSGPGSAPTLSVQDYGQMASGGSLSMQQVIAPPSTVYVTSTAGGYTPMDIAVGTASNTPTLPTAMNDSLLTTEDVAGTVAVMTNDVALGANPTIVLPAQGTPGYPVIGTITLVDPRTVLYTPNANANGGDIFTYRIRLADGSLTNPALVSVTIAATNDAPAAINDSFQGLRNFSTQVNLLANDTDADGAADLATGQAGVDLVDSNVLASLGLTAGYHAGSLLTITPAANTAGVYTIQYRAVDASGTRSLNAASMTVTVSALEAIVPAKTNYTPTKSRWVISGTVSPNTRQTVTLTYANGTFKVNGVCGPNNNAAGFELARVTVDPTSTYTWDTVVPLQGMLNPTNTGNPSGFWCSAPTAVRVTSLLSGVSASQALIAK